MAPTRKKCDWENSKAWGAYKSSKMIYTVKFWTYPISMTNYQIFIYSAKLSTIIYIIPTIKYSYIVLNYQLSYISSQLSSIHIYIYISTIIYEPRTRRSAEVLTGTAVADIPTTAAIPTTGTAGHGKPWEHWILVHHNTYHLVMSK